MKRVLVSFSGGQDSTTVLYRCIREFGKEQVHPVHFYYGQRHYPGEAKAVVMICGILGMEHEQIDFDLSQFGRSVLTEHDKKIPAQSEHKQGSTVVPFRNTMFLVHLAAKAVTEDFDVIALGSTYEDLAEYPDCRPEYFKAMEHALRLADRHHHLEIYTPYVDVKKSDMSLEGIRLLKVPYEWTHTCYGGEWKKPCRVCDACKEREASFEAIGMIDPLIKRLGYGV